MPRKWYNIYRTKESGTPKRTAGRENKMKKVNEYLKRIKVCMDRNEIEGIRIEFSCDLSLTWAEFEKLYKAQQNKRAKILNALAK